MAIYYGDIMNQSFSAENFRDIFYSENRKGNNLEFEFDIFNPLTGITNELVSINNAFNSGTYSTIGEKNGANQKKEQLKKDKFELLKKILFDEVELKIEQSIFKTISISIKKIKSKMVYSVDTDKPEIYFLFKQLYKNLQFAFQVTPSDRNLIVKQVINVLNNNFPKYIIRADIKDFFESIPHDKLKKIINCNSKLSPSSKKIIYFILNKYKEITGLDKGIPRGIGISAFLSEVYLKEIDDYIKSMPNLTYYARYVDDMILVFTPTTKYDDYSGILNDLQDKVEKIGLTLHDNSSKKKEIDQFSVKKKSTDDFDFLGYNLVCSNGSIRVGLAKKKIDKYKVKIDNAINSYNKSLSQSNLKNFSNYKLLINRIKFLTGNTRLFASKSNTVIGIYCSNSLLSDSQSLSDLDQYLQAKIQTITVGTQYKTILDIKNELNQFKFTKGFDDKLFYNFTKKQLTNIMKVF